MSMDRWHYSHRKGGCNVESINNDCYDAHNNQVDCNLIAYNPLGYNIGYIDYSIFENQIHINIVNVRDDCRKTGIATSLMNKLKQQKMPIKEGLKTEHGGKFWEVYNK